MSLADLAARAEAIASLPKTDQVKGRVDLLRDRALLDAAAAEAFDDSDGFAELIEAHGATLGPRIRAQLKERIEIIGIARAKSRAARAIEDRASERSDAAAERVANDASNEADSDPRPTVLVTGYLVDMVEQSLDALSSHPNLYQRGSSLACVRDDPVFGVGITTIREPLLRFMLAEVAQFTEDDDDAIVPVVPPKLLSDTILSLTSWPFLILDGIARAPTMRRDGSILNVRGYDRATRLLCDWDRDLHVEVRDMPGIDDADAAMAKILDVFDDFPFESDAHRSGAVAALLTIVGRTAIDGPCPLFLINAATPGTGKTLLADMIGVIATGDDLPHQPYPEDDDEMRKRITGIAEKAPVAILLDNVAYPLGGPSMDAVLTSRIWEDRALGRNGLVTFLMTVVWLASGNNVQIRGDLLRRVMPIRLASTLDRPEDRTSFKYPDLPSTIRERRQELLSAALTILRGYAAQGRPGAVTLGGFESWSRVVRSAIIWAGQPDPCLALAALRADADPRMEEDADLVRSWRLCYAERAALLSDVASDIETVTSATSEYKSQNPAYDLWRAFRSIDRLWRKRDGSLDTTQLGYRLRSVQGRVFNVAGPNGTRISVRMSKGEPKSDRQTWRAELV